MPTYNICDHVDKIAKVVDKLVENSNLDISSDEVEQAENFVNSICQLCKGDVSGGVYDYELQELCAVIDPK